MSTTMCSAMDIPSLFLERESLMPKGQELKYSTQFWNKLVKGETICDGETIHTPDMVMGAERKGLKVSYCTDSRPVLMIAEYVKDADLFICEGIYGEEGKEEKAREISI